jgi:hypothetical protein
LVASAAVAAAAVVVVAVAGAVADALVGSPSQPVPSECHKKSGYRRGLVMSCSAAELSNPASAAERFNSSFDTEGLRPPRRDMSVHFGVMRNAWLRQPVFR